MEELRREMSHGTYGNALVTAVASVAVTRLCLGYDSTFHLADSPPLPLTAYPMVILVGLLASLLGIVFNRSLLRMTSRKYPAWLLGAVVGACGGLFVLFLPEVTGGGHDLTRRLLEGENHAASWLAGLLLLKLLFTLLSYATGAPGGIFAPILSLGALLGYLTGTIGMAWAPLFTPSPARLATVGMAALLSACVHAPLTGVVLIVEMTGQ